MAILNYKTYRRLNETITTDDLVFNTKVQVVYHYNIISSDYVKKLNPDTIDIRNVEFTDNNFTIKWSLDLDIRPEYVKNIEIIISNVIGDFNVTLENDDTDDIIQQATFNAKTMGFQIVNKININNGESISPTDIEIDFRNKVVSIS